VCPPTDRKLLTLSRQTQTNSGAKHEAFKTTASEPLPLAAKTKTSALLDDLAAGFACD
jgi:hypothetical protein